MKEWRRAAIALALTPAALMPAFAGPVIAPIAPIAAPLGSAQVYAALLVRQQAGEILDLGAVVRPGIATIAGNGDLFLLQGSGRFEKLRGGERADLFVAEGAVLPKGAEIVQRGVPRSLVRDANLLSTRGRAGSHEELIEQIIAEPTYDRVLAPRETVRAQLSNVSHAVEKLTAFVENQAPGWSAYLASPAYRDMSLVEKKSALERLSSAP